MPLTTAVSCPNEASGSALALSTPHESLKKRSRLPLTLAGPVHSEQTIKKSRFLGCVQPMPDRAGALQVVAALRAQQPALLPPGLIQRWCLRSRIKRQLRPCAVLPDVAGGWDQAVKVAKFGPRNSCETRRYKTYKLLN